MIRKLKDGEGRFELSLRKAFDSIGIDPYDIDSNALEAYCEANEQSPVSRFWFGSPCRFVKTIDKISHVYTPAAIAERFPEAARKLRSTSPRWGRSCML